MCKVYYYFFSLCGHHEAGYAVRCRLRPRCEQTTTQIAVADMCQRCWDGVNVEEPRLGGESLMEMRVGGCGLSRLWMWELRRACADRR